MKKILSQGGQKLTKGGKSPMINVVVTKEILEAISNYGWENRITRSEAARQLLTKGIEIIKNDKIQQTDI